MQLKSLPDAFGEWRHFSISISKTGLSFINPVLTGSGDLDVFKPALAPRRPFPPSVACGQGEFISTLPSIQRDLTPWSVKRSCAKVMEKLVSESAQRLFLTSSVFIVSGEKPNCVICCYYYSLSFFLTKVRGVVFTDPFLGAFWKLKAVWEIILDLLYCCLRKAGRAWNPETGKS